MRGWAVFFWALIATLVLITAGIFASLVIEGRVSLTPDVAPTAAPIDEVTPVVDTSYSVVVLNATPETGLATQTKDLIVAAGWPAETVFASEAGSTDFAETTIYYVLPEDEAAAEGLADVIGGATTTQSDFYQPIDDADTADVDESTTKQLTVVLGADRLAAPSAEPTQ